MCVYAYVTLCFVHLCVPSVRTCTLVCVCVCVCVYVCVCVCKPCVQHKAIFRMVIVLPSTFECVLS